MSGLTQDLLLTLFVYKDGELYWAVDRRRIKAGSIAGTINSTGRKHVSINGKLYKVHRVIYAMHYGETPDFIDHIDGNPLNNRIENLRAATCSENMCNVGAKTNNKTGEKGVVWNALRQRWIAYCYVKGKKTYAGYHKKFESAVDAVRELRAKLHGSFARN
jgi:hypothetical protein